MAVPSFAKSELQLFESKHFALLTRDGEKDAVSRLLKAEAVREAFGHTLGLSLAPSLKVLLVNAEAREIADLGKEYGMGSEYTGVLLRTFGESAQIIRNGDFFESLQDRRIIYAFIAASIINNAIHNSPPWLSTGISGCMQSADVHTDYVRLGTEVQAYKSALQYPKEAISLRDLLQNPNYLAREITPFDDLPNEKRPTWDPSDTSVRIHLQAEAKAWIFCYYCLFGKPKEYREKFQRFIKGISSGEEVTDKYFQSCFDMSFDEMDKRLQKAVTNLGFSGMKIPTTKEMAGTITQTRVPLEELRLLYRCTLYKIEASQQTRSESNSALLQELNSFEFTNPYVASFAAAIGHQVDPNDRALHEKLENKALALGANHNFLFIRQIERLHSDVGDDIDYRMPAALCSRIRSYADISLAMNPDSENMKNLLVWIEAHSEKIRFSVINPILREINGWKRNDEALLNLALIQFRCGNLDNSAMILKALRESSYSNSMIARLDEEIQAKREKLIKGGASQ